MSKAKNLVRKQIRGFVLAWMTITLLVSGVTFFAVYLTYGGGIQNPSVALARSDVAFPSPTPQEETVAAVAADVTLPPTLAIDQPTATSTPTPTPTATAVLDGFSVAQAEVSTDTPAPTVAPTATPWPINDQSFQMGIQVQYAIDGSQQTQNLWIRDVAQNMRLPWFKQQVRWEFIEPERGVYDWLTLDMGVRAARRFGVNMMISVVTAPDWAREPGVDLSKHGPPADPQDYVNFVVEIVNRHGDHIAAIEVWNEQNLDREWMSNRGLRADDYVDLLRRTYQAVKAINPNIIIISGALAPSGGWVEPDGRVSAMDDFTYFDAMIDAGLLNYADCIGAHHNGYNIGPSVTWDNVPNDPTAEFRGPFDNPHHSWSFRSTLETYANRIRLAGGNQKLCVTEFGWASVEDMDGYPAGFEFAKDNTLEEQRDWTMEAIRNMEEWGFVWLAFLWNFNYGPQAGWDTSNDNVPYSIIGPDFVHRPLYGALVEWGQARAAEQ